jgi:hypothetical protein
MMTKVSAAVVVALLIGLVGSAPAQDAPKPEVAKGVSSRGLVTSLGGFSATVNAPVFVNGATVEIQPGGQTGRQQFRVPTFIYVLDGIMTSFYDAGPIGIAGTQYHAAGQSFMDNSGWWHNYANRTDKPLKLLFLHIGYPGRPDPVQKAESE